MNNTVYILPGRGHKINDIGDMINCLGFDVCGRELLPPFSNVSFSDQLMIIQKDLLSLFWDNRANLVGHSYGGYLLLHSLSEIKPFPGKILLFSPVLGIFIDKKKLYASRPPRVNKLLENKMFPTPRYLEIHTGEIDNECNPNFAKKIGALIPGSKINIIKNQGHKLDAGYMNNVLSEFLKLP